MSIANRTCTAQTAIKRRMPPIVIAYGDIRRGKALPPNITNQMTDNQLKEFETVFKIGIVKQLEQNGLLTAEQSAQLVDMQKRKVVKHGR